MNNIKIQLETAFNNLLDVAKLEKGSILVVGCSTSEVLGEKIGSSGSLDCAKAIFEVLQKICKENGIFLAAQCCEHLNRAIVIEKEAYDYYRLSSRVNVVPQIHAGGSFATTVYSGFENPVVVEHIKADAGIDIGDTFIGMHLKEVAVPVRVGVSSIGDAHLTCARTRYKYIGGERAVYNPTLN
jgi:uncharacterized protein (TIGR01440 family)